MEDDEIRDVMQGMIMSHHPATPAWARVVCPECKRADFIVSGRDAHTGKLLLLGTCSVCGVSLVEPFRLTKRDAIAGALETTYVCLHCGGKLQIAGQRDGELG